MTRRCKPGQRARIIVGYDSGKFVLVVRHYHGEDVAGATWPEAIFPWVVASLGGPLESVDVETGVVSLPSMMAVYDDCELEPLPDDDEPAESTDLAVRPARGGRKSKEAASS